MLQIHSFESMAARDGKGLRYAVFLAGCPLRCIYCHNPDTWSIVNGHEYSVEAVLNKIIRCKPYMDAGNGGVTFSGGEPMLQAKDLYLLINQLADNDLTSCIDTSGCLQLTKDIKNTFLAASSVLLDLKFYNEIEYKQYTGADLHTVLATLQFLADNDITTTIRTVIIPNLNDSETALDAYSKLLNPFKNFIHEWELLPFHTMGFDKYSALGVDNPLINTPALSHDKLQNLQHYAESLIQ